MCFTPNGDDLLVGKYKGVIRIVDATNAEYKKTSMELKTSDSDHGKFLTYMKVSEDGKNFALTTPKTVFASSNTTFQRAKK